MKSSGCSSGSIIIWFATLLLRLRYFSAYCIVAHLIRSVFTSTIAKIRLFCYWKLHDDRHWMKSSGCSSGSTIIWFATLLLPLWFSVHIALSLIQIIPYSFSRLLRFIYGGIESFMTTDIGWNAEVSRLEALLSDLPPSTAVTIFHCI
jgi:hypothetical protein